MYNYLGTDKIDSPLSCSADLMKMEFLYVRSASLQVDNLMRFIVIQVHQQRFEVAPHNQYFSCFAETMLKCTYIG